MPSGSRNSRSGARSDISRTSTSSQSSGVPAVPKAERYDAENRPVANLFGKEVMRALNSRGGAMWLRELQAIEMKKQAAGVGVETADWGGAVDGAAGKSAFSSEALAEYIGIPDIANKINMSVMNKVLDQMQRIGKDKDAEELDFKAFFNACTGGGLNVTEQQAKLIFEKIDENKGGTITPAEWMGMLEKSRKKHEVS